MAETPVDATTDTGPKDALKILAQQKALSGAGRAREEHIAVTLHFSHACS